MKLYYSKGACSLAVRITINEIGLSCDYEAVDLKTKKTETGTDFLTINPKGSVPTLQLDNGEILTENAVIHQYLADTAHATSLLPACGDFNRYRVLEALNFISTDIHKGFSPFFNPFIPEQLKEEVFKPKLKKYFSIEDEQLNNSDFIAGKNFTIADAYLFVMLLWTGKMHIDIKDFKNLSRYFEALKNRKSISQSLSEEKLG